MFRRSLLAVVAALALAGPAAAQLDPEPRQPYQWRVVLSVRPHPLLNQDFRDRLKRDLVAALQPQLGPLGAVEAIDLADLPRDRWEPLWQQFEDKGFAALDAPRDLTGAKTHFLRVEYRDGAVRLASRQYDGFTGLSSPLVRAQATRAPELAGRVAAPMLDRDFGPVGTVEPGGRPNEARVVPRGAALGPAGPAARAGDVFAVAAVRNTNRPAPPVLRTATGKLIQPPPGSVAPPGLTATPREFTLLKVLAVEPGGALRCAVLSRYEKPLPASPGVLGYRAMKLGTVTAPVAVRLARPDGTVYKTASAVNVRASDAGFVTGAEARDVCTFDSRTFQFRSARELSGVACVTVALGETQAKQFPLPILSGDPITVTFNIDPADERRAEFERAVLAAARAAADARLAQSICFRAVSELVNKQKNADALARARGGFESADAALKSLTDELARLREEGKSVDKAAGVDVVLAKMAANLQALKKQNDELAPHIKLLAKVVERENDPALAAKEVQAEEINSRIRLLLARGEVDEALAAYDQLAALLGDADTRKRRDDLATEWKPKDEAHQKAREFVTRTWDATARGGTIGGLKDALPQLRRAVAECKKHKDVYTLRKLLNGLDQVYVRLNELVTALDPAAEGDKAQLAEAAKLDKELQALEQDARKFVGG